MSVDEKYKEQVKFDEDIENKEEEENKMNDMSFEEFLKSRGETAEKVEENAIVIPYDYKLIRWNDCVDEEVYGGKAVLSEIIEKSYPNKDVIQEYVPELLNELGWTYDKIAEVMGHDGAKNFFNDCKLCSEETYHELIEKIGIDKLRCYKKYEELLDIKYGLELYLISEGDKEAYLININLYSDENIQQVGRQSKLFKLRIGLYELDYPGASMQYNRLGVNIDTLRKDLEKIPLLALKVRHVPAQGNIRDYNDFVVVDASKYDFEYDFE